MQQINENGLVDAGDGISLIDVTHKYDESATAAVISNIVPLMTVAIDFDGYIIHSWSSEGYGHSRQITNANNITQLIGWEAASFLMLECSDKGMAEGPVRFGGGERRPPFSYCYMRLSGDRSCIQCYLRPTTDASHRRGRAGQIAHDA